MIPVEYLGIIAKKDSKSKIYIVTIEGKQHFLKRGSEVNGVKLISGNDSEITVEFEGARKKIKRLP